MRDEQELRTQRLCEALAVESRCLLALLRLGCELAQAEALLTESLGARLMADGLFQPSALCPPSFACAGLRKGSQRQSKRGLSLG